MNLSFSSRTLYLVLGFALIPIRANRVMSEAVLGLRNLVMGATLAGH